MASLPVVVPMFVRQAKAIWTSFKIERAPKPEVDAHRLKLLAEMVEHCRALVAFYAADAYATGPITSLGDFERLPLLDKATLRSLPPETFFARGLDRSACVPFVTSGSTGKRVEGLHDTECHDYHTGALVRRFHATGRYLPYYRLTHVKPYPAPKKWHEWLGLFRRHVVASSLPMPEIVEETLANRPQVLLGIPTYLREFVRTCTPGQLARLKSSLKAVFTESELLLDVHRAELEQALGVPVFDEYSAFEVLNVYYECSSGGRHIAEDRVYVEVVDDAGHPMPEGAEGHLVVTSFMERGMPLIRYKLGDLGRIVPGPCACGRTFRTMEVTRGRTSDHVVLPSGRKLFWADVILVVMSLADALDCHVHQDKTGKVTFYFVPRHPGDALAETVKAQVRERLFAKSGEVFPLEVEATAMIPKTEGGKSRFVFCEYAGPLAMGS